MDNNDGSGGESGGPAVKRAKLQPEPRRIFTAPDWERWSNNLEILQQHLVSGCLCQMPLLELQRPARNLEEQNGQTSSVQPQLLMDYSIHFITTIHLLIDAALKQQFNGFICKKLMDMASAIAMDETTWDILLEYLNYKNKFLVSSTSKTLVSLLMWTRLPNLNEIVDELFKSAMITDDNPLKLTHILEVIKGVVDYKYHMEEPLLIEEQQQVKRSSTTDSTFICPKVEVDTEIIENEVKTLCVTALERWWTRLLTKFQNMMNHYNPQSEFPIAAFLSLWLSIISGDNSISVIDIKHYFLHLEAFVPLLNPNSPPIIWSGLVNIFNEILCYGKTLALQGDVPNEEHCDLAHLIIKSVRSRQFLQGIPYSTGFIGFGGSHIGPVDWGECKSQQQVRDNAPRPTLPSSSSSPPQCEKNPPVPVTQTVYIGPSRSAIQLDTSFDENQLSPGDRPLLQKVVLLVLKSVAVTVQEAKFEDVDMDSSFSDCEDDSAGPSSSRDIEGNPNNNNRYSSSSSDTEMVSDMTFVENTIRHVFRELDLYIKSVQPFHPSTPLGEWIIKLFLDQDDALIEAIVCTLDTYQGFLQRNTRKGRPLPIPWPPQDFREQFHPIKTFVSLLSSTSFDYTLLQDWLSGPETPHFLTYFLHLVKFMTKNWSDFSTSCGHELERVMSLLIRLRMGVGRLVERGLWPYNINPILRRLEQLEKVYEEEGLKGSSSNNIMLINPLNPNRESLRSESTEPGPSSIVVPTFSIPPNNSNISSSSNDNNNSPNNSSSREDDVR